MKRPNRQSLSALLARSPEPDTAVLGPARALAPKDWLFIIALLAAVILVYQPVWRGGFILDDDLHLLNNPVLKPGGLLKTWVPGTYLNYWPLTFTAYRLQFDIWGLDPLGFHLVNIALHAISALLVWRILLQLNAPGAMFAAALFALHPVNVESVAWIAQLKNILSLLLALLSVLLYLLSEEKGKRWCMVLSISVFLLLTLAKGMVLTLPVVLLACAWWQRGRIGRQDLLRVLPFLLIGALMTCMEVWGQHLAGGGETMVRSDSFFARTAVAGCAVWFYLWKLIWPVKLIFVYPRWSIDPRDVLSYLPGVLLVAILALGWWQRRGWGRPVVMLMVCYVGLLLPVLGFVNVAYMRFSLVADHYQYAAMIVPCAIFAAVMATLGRPLWHRPTGYALCLASLAVLAGLTWRQNRRYVDAETLYRTTIAENPDCWLAHNNLGVLMAARGQTDEAIAHYRKALDIHPRYAEAQCNLGMALTRCGQVAEAIQHYQRALKIKPDSTQVMNNLAWLRATCPDASFRNEAEAVKVALLALELTRGRDANILDTLAAAYAEAGRFPEAVQTVQGPGVGHATEEPVLDRIPEGQDSALRSENSLSRYPTALGPSVQPPVVVLAEERSSGEHPSMTRRNRPSLPAKSKEPQQDSFASGDARPEGPPVQSSSSTAARSFGPRDWLFVVALVVAVFLIYQPAWHGGLLMDDDAHVPPPNSLLARPVSHLVRRGGHTAVLSLVGDRFLGAAQAMGRCHVGLSLGKYRLARPDSRAGSAGAATVEDPRGLSGGGHLRPASGACRIGGLDHGAEEHAFGRVLPGAALAYLRFDQKRGKAWYLAALVLFVLALASKIVTVTLPAALLVIFWWQRGRVSWRRDVLPLMPFFLIGVVAGVFITWVERKVVGAEGPDFALTVVQRCLLPGRVIWFYLGKLCWPTDLRFMYPRWEIDPGVWWQYLFPLALLLLVGLLWWLSRRWRGPLAGLLFFAGTLFPVLGFLNVYWFVFSFVADHFQYLASLGIIALAAAGAALLLARWRLWGRPGGYAACLVSLAVLGSLTWRQSRMYSDVETLYQTVIAENPNCWLAYNNLGVILAGRGQFDKAMANYWKALEIKPDYPQAYYNLGAALTECGRLDEAIVNYRKALEIKPDYAAAYNNLGTALAGRGQFDEAIIQYEKALEIRPNYTEARNNLGLSLAMRGRVDEAIAQYQKALELNPDFADAYNNLGNALAKCGRLDEAIAQYEKVLEIKPDHAEAANNLGNLLLGRGKADEAVCAVPQGAGNQSPLH